MRTLRLIVALSLCLLVGGMLHAQDHSRISPFVGTSSCSASNCHGSPPETGHQLGDAEAWKSSYTIWSKFDPHAQSHASLFKQRSVRIVGRLHGSEVKPDSAEYQQLLAERCLDCHATAGEPRLAMSGVSCESCHGPAAGWEATHYLKQDFATKPVQLDDLEDRATACVRCHVGPVTKAEPESAEVDHELIAAGHPRLQFEFSAYLAAMPVHWDLAADVAGRTKKRRDFFAEAWSVGQRVTQRAVIEQLQRRLKTATGPEKSTWPEFAEYDCFACHHGIGKQASSSGRLTWGSWSFATAAALWRTDRDPDVKSWLTFQQNIAKSLHDPARLGEDAARLRQQWQTGITVEDAGSELSRYLLDADPQSFRNWDEVSQWYLAGQAAYRSLAWSALKDKATAPELKAFEQSLQAFRRRLTFDRGGGTSAVPRRLWDSPGEFDPQSAELTEHVRELQRLIHTSTERGASAP